MTHIVLLLIVSLSSLSPTPIKDKPLQEIVVQFVLATLRIGEHCAHNTRGLSYSPESERASGGRLYPDSSCIAMADTNVVYTIRIDSQRRTI
jgi:hypothetical protein